MSSGMRQASGARQRLVPHTDSAARIAVADAGSSASCTTSQEPRSIDGVAWQPDGLPRLPSHLDFPTHYDGQRHCPMCSLGEGEQHKQGLPSHATALIKQAALAPPAAGLRSIDATGLALVQSLRRPKASPSWWGPRYADKQAWCAEKLESSAVHYTIIALTLLDLAFVVTELILSAIYPDMHEAPEQVHTAEDALGWGSVGILSVFVVELGAKLLVFGYTYFTRSWWHLFDLVVVVASLVLELTLRGVGKEVASLLVLFRLWRILRVMHGVAEAMELKQEGTLEQHHRLVHGLQQDLAAQRRRISRLEREAAALAGAAAGAGVDVAGVLRLAAAAASHPDLLRLEAAAAGAVAGSAARGGLDPAAAALVADAALQAAESGGSDGQGEAAPNANGSARAAEDQV